MKSTCTVLLLAIVGCSLFIPTQFAHAQTSAFTYQGQLNDNGSPANGLYDLTFTLLNASSGGAIVGVSSVVNDIAITNGLFTVTLDYGTLAFDGGDRWLEIAVRSGASAGGFTSIAPRQKIASTPYAVRAQSAASAGSAAILTGNISASQITGTLASSNIGVGTITSTHLAAGAAAANLNAAGQSGVPSGGIVLSRNDNDGNLANAGYVKIGSVDLGAEAWRPRAGGSLPTARSGYTAVWTGSEMIVWGGYNGSYLNDGGHHRRALSALRSHGGVDGQRDDRLGGDRLGRIRRHLFERHLQLHPRSCAVSLPAALDMGFKYQVSSFRLGGALGALLVLCSAGLAGDFTSLCSDRAAIERVFYNHRLGEKPPFEQVLPPATLENLVRQDLRKEAALKQAYGVEVTPAMLDAEVQRINTTTRAPEVLAEIKIALGNDPARFANVFAKPILVERLLREKFDNDDALHAVQRREVEKVREELLAAKRKGKPAADLASLLPRGRSNHVFETTWQLGSPLPETSATTADLIEVQKRFGPNAQVLSSPKTNMDRKFYFENLPAELQKVLRVQLRHSDDVSAVIETPSSFLLYLTKEKTDAVLTVIGLSLPKRSYEEWLVEPHP